MHFSGFESPWRVFSGFLNSFQTCITSGQTQEPNEQCISQLMSTFSGMTVGCVQCIGTTMTQSIAACETLCAQQPEAAACRDCGQGVVNALNSACGRQNNGNSAQSRIPSLSQISFAVAFLLAIA